MISTEGQQCSLKRKHLCKVQQLLLVFGKQNKNYLRLLANVIDFD